MKIFYLDNFSFNKNSTYLSLIDNGSDNYACYIVIITVIIASESELMNSCTVKAKGVERYKDVKT